MEEFKVDLFKEEYNKDFPPYVKIEEAECENIRKLISKAYGIEADSSSIDFVKSLSQRQRLVDGYNAEESFSLVECLNDCGVSPMSDVYINWYRFDAVDKMPIDVLNAYFEYIWFPSADDIDIFDDSLNWILSINHDGTVSIALRV